MIILKANKKKIENITKTKHTRESEKVKGILVYLKIYVGITDKVWGFKKYLQFRYFNRVYFKNCCWLAKDGCFR